jgi:hypothetical protein
LDDDYEATIIANIHV